MKKHHHQSMIRGLAFTLILATGGCQKNLSDTASLSPVKTATTAATIMPNLSTTGIGGYDLKGYYDHVLPFDAGHSGRQDYLLCYRPANEFVWLLDQTPANTYAPVFKSNSGIGGYNLADNYDLITTFDYEHSGRQDYLAAYRPGSVATGNTIFIIKNLSTLQNPTPNFQAIVQDHNGIGGVGITNPGKVTAFDYDHSGKQDYLVIANFAAHTCDILKNNNNGTFTPVFHSATGLDKDPFAGVYSAQFAYPAEDAPKDVLFAFDYNHSGLKDHLVHVYNANSYDGLTPSYFNADIFIDGNNNNGTFTTKVHLALGTTSPDLIYTGVKTEVVAFDYEHSGKADYLVVSQPNPYSPRIYVLKNNNDGTLTPVYQQINGSGLGGWDFKDENDHIVAIDYDHSGKMDYLFVWRGEKGICSIIKNTNGVFTPVL